MSISKKQTFICVIGFALTVGAFLSYKGCQVLAYKSPYERFFVNGYDFRGMQDADEDFSRLRAGEQFDLGKIVTSNGTKLEVNHDMLLLAVVDPKCAFCTISSDIYDGLRAGLPENVRYTAGIFNRRPDESDLNEFGRSIGFQEVTTWESESNPPESLSRMPTPAHILLDDSGTVMQVWFGSSRDKVARERMTEQMLQDIRLILRVYPAIKKNV